MHQKFNNTRPAPFELQGSATQEQQNFIDNRSDKTLNDINSVVDHYNKNTSTVALKDIATDQTMGDLLDQTTKGNARAASALKFQAARLNDGLGGQRMTNYDVQQSGGNNSLIAGALRKLQNWGIPVDYKTGEDGSITDMQFPDMSNLDLATKLKGTNLLPQDVEEMNALKNLAAYRLRKQNQVYVNLANKQIASKLGGRNDIQLHNLTGDQNDMPMQGVQGDVLNAPKPMNKSNPVAQPTQPPKTVQQPATSQPTQQPQNQSNQQSFKVGDMYQGKQVIRTGKDSTTGMQVLMLKDGSTVTP
jgi:hypothetical protein